MYATTTALVDRSRDYLLAARRGEETAHHREALAALDPDDLPTLLAGDAEKYAFWTNVYNAVVQDRLRDDPSRYDSRRRFFDRGLMTVAGEKLSLNDIEHGLLRRSQLWFGLGYLTNPLASGFEKVNRVDERDCRIHFALNCGAASCPAIAAYDAGNIDDQLALATESFLHATTEYDTVGDVARVSRFFLWYRGDFGGRAGIVDLLTDHGVVPLGSSPKLRYHEYDWSLALDDAADRR